MNKIKENKMKLKGWHLEIMKGFRWREVRREKEGKKRKKKKVRYFKWAMDQHPETSITLWNTIIQLKIG